jgi:signal transduction histidine kinase
VNALGAGAPDGWPGADPPDQARLGQLAEEQAALRRVATLVARATPPEAVFAAVAEEAGRVLSAGYVQLGRYEPDGTLTSIAHWGATTAFPAGTRWSPGGKNIITLVFETGHPARIDDYADASGPTGASAGERGVGSAAGAPVIVAGRLWGVVVAGTRSGQQPLPPGIETRLASFTELLATAVANTESRAALARLAQEQAALRRVATLVARATPPEEVFAAVAEEAGRLLGVDFAILVRYDPQDTLEVVGTWTRTGAPAPTPVGGQLPLGGRNVTTLVHQTGRPARIDYSDVTGVIGQVASQGWGLRSSVGVPVSAESRLWGCIVVAFSGEGLLPADTEARLASFTELVATAIANADSRASLARLAEEQAALRRVATLVAHGAPQEEVFAAVIEEIARLLPVNVAGFIRYDPDGMFTYVAAWGEAVDYVPPVGSRWMLGGHNLGTLVFETGRPARLDHYVDNSSGPASYVVRKVGYNTAVGAPVIVEGHLWGLIGASSTLEQPLPPDTEARLASFTELVAMAIANADSRAQLIASRARIVAASDEARRRIERDLHDGTQQRLVSLGLAARLAEADAGAGRAELRAELSRIGAGLADAVAELQELSRGIHPAALSVRGLVPALRTLARRCAVPVDLEVATDARFPEPVEIAAYYVASEALANAMKHARASGIEISLAAGDASLLLSIRDDGVGGADPGRGSGLAGLADRVEALGGSIRVQSAAGAGTHIAVDLPREYELAHGAG